MMAQSTTTIPNEMQQTIKPYRKAGHWMFDDDSKHLREERLFLGTGELLDAALKRARVWPGAHAGFKFHFSDEANDQWERADFEALENGGAWYICREQRGLLSPILMGYFLSPPQTLWFRVRPMFEPAEIAAHYQDPWESE